MSDFLKNNDQEPLQGNGHPENQDLQPKVVSAKEIPKIAKTYADNIKEVPDVQILLESLLPHLQPINYRDKAGITDDKAKLINKHYIVLTVEEVLEAALSQNYGLCTRNNSTYCYNGCYWQYIPPDELKYFLGKAAAKLGVEMIDAKWYPFQDDLLKQFMVSAHLAKAKVVRGRTLINLLNGTFEISPEGQRPREFRPEDFLTHQLLFSYDPDAEAPLFHKYLDYVLPDEASQKNIAEYIGSVFINNDDLRLEQVLLLQGGGRNGKSVMQLIITALLGEHNISTFGLQNLTDTGGYYRAEFANKLANISSEMSNKIESSTFKQLASGEPVEARSPYGKPFSLRNYGKMIFNCNLLPADVEHTEAFFRRWLIIEFGRTITEEEKDVELPMKIIKNELSGVFNWVLKGLNRILEQKKFTENQAAKDKLAQFKRQSDNVALFLDDENYISDANEIIPQKEVYEQYSTYCVESGYRKCSMRVFGDRLEKLGIIREKRNVGMVLFITKKDS